MTPDTDYKKRCWSPAVSLLSASNAVSKDPKMVSSEGKWAWPVLGGVESENAHVAA